MPFNVICGTTILIFQKQMLQGANTDIFNPIVSKAPIRECRNLPFPLQINPVKVS